MFTKTVSNCRVSKQYVCMYVRVFHKIQTYGRIRVSADYNGSKACKSPQHVIDKSTITTSVVAIVNENASARVIEAKILKLCCSWALTKPGKDEGEPVEDSNDDGDENDGKVEDFDGASVQR